MSAKLYTETLGEGPDLVLLHGWGLHSGIWQTLKPLLATQFRLTLVDLPGCGLSPALETDYTFQTITEKIFEVVPSNATWLGWSLGGLLTLWTAIHQPHYINKAIIVASTPKFMADPQWSGISFGMLQNFAADLKADYQTTLTKFISLQFFNSPHSKELKIMLKAILSRGHPALKSLSGCLKLLSHADLRPDLATISCPTHYIFGRSDILVPMTTAEQIIHWHPSATVAVIRHAGHAPFLSHPEEFVDLILK